MDEKRASTKRRFRPPGWTMERFFGSPERDAAMVGTGRVSASSLSLGTTAVNLGVVKVRNSQPWIKRAGRTHAAAKRFAQRYGGTITGLRLVKDCEFASLSHRADNTQGRCAWFAYPVLNPSETDQLALQFVTDLRDNTKACQLHYIDVNILCKSASSNKCELDCWLLWPKRDIPRDNLIIFNDGTNNFPLTDAWFYGVDPPFMKYGYAPGGANSDTAGTYVTATTLNTNADYKVTNTPYYDWTASPYENNYITDNFHISYKFNRVFNPGDEMEIHTGVPNQLIYPWTQTELIRNTGILNPPLTEAFKNNYAHMRRNGPILLLRARGRLAHLEAAEQDATPTFGLFNLDMAILRSICSSEVVAADVSAANQRGVHATGYPSIMGQGTAAATGQWFMANPADAGFNT